MKSIESSAKTIEDAIRKGLETLDVSLGDVSIDIIHEGSKGLFGIMGSKDAKVRLTVKDDEQEDDVISSLSPAAKPTAESKPVRPRQNKRKKQPQPKNTEPAAAPKSAVKKEMQNTPVKQHNPQDAAASANIAQDFIQNVTKLMNLDVTIESNIDNDGNVLVNIHGDTLGILIGRRGETLDALQYLTSLNVNHGKDDYTRVTLDTENYRAKREEALKRLANRMANRAVKTGRKVVLEPMNPYERRILHSALQQNNNVTTHSEGDEPNRHIVISLKS